VSAYYNDNDSNVCRWLEELIRRGHIARGVVDCRSILEVKPEDVKGYAQCHFFAGIGGWSLACRLAGWDDERPIWTGSPPCQPFSAAGKQLGKLDARHLAPAWLSLVEAVRPPVVAGEQVAAAVNKDDWLDDLLDALEGFGYATGAVALPACGVGSPHIRSRLWFVGRLADAERWTTERYRHEVGTTSGREQDETHERKRVRDDAQHGVDPLRLADAEHAERWSECRHREDGRDGKDDRREEAHGELGACGEVRGLADATSHGRRQGDEDCRRRGGGDAASVERTGSADDIDACGLADADGGDTCTEWQQCSGEHRQQPQDGSPMRRTDCGPWDGSSERMGGADAPHDGWSAVDWIYCRDHKWRAVEPGTFPLAHGISARVVRLRGYGNAIVPQVAVEVIKEMM
jgi:DNA (cytosine-5)-methyltransferase 1